MSYMDQAYCKPGEVIREGQRRVRNSKKAGDGKNWECERCLNSWSPVGSIIFSVKVPHMQTSGRSNTKCHVRTFNGLLDLSLSWGSVGRI
jgi:hypothetical protein